MDSSSVVVFTRAHLDVVVLIQDRSVDSHAPWVSLGSFGVVRFTRVRPGGRWVHSRACAPVVHPESLGAHACVLGFFRGGWVYSHAPWRSFDSYRVFGFTRTALEEVGFIYVRLGGRWESLGLLMRALVVVGFIWGNWVH